MPESWKEWEGQTIDGRFPLLRYAGESEHSVVFLTEREEGGALVPAAIKMVPAGSDNGERQLEQWRQAAKVSHPNLISLYETGRCDLGGIAALYVVMERADENLAQIVPGRALAADETRAVLESTVEVLSSLHARGFVHGRIKPSNILASGSQLKISSDGLSRAGDSVERRDETTPYDPPEYKPSVIAVPQTMAPSGDLWSLGMVLVESLVQSLPQDRGDQQQNPALPQSLPQPFLEIASHCLVRHPQGRWTALQVSDCLHGRMKAPEPQAAAQPEIRQEAARAAEPPLEFVPPLEPVHQPQRQPQQSTQSQVPSQPPRPPQQRRRPRPARRASAPPAYARRQGFALPILIGLGAVVIAAIIGVKFFGSHSEPAPATVAMNSNTAAPASPPAPVSPPHGSLVTPPAPAKQSSRKPSPDFAENDAKSNAPDPTPALTHPSAAPEVDAAPVAKFPTATPARGEVAHQALPQVLASAQNSIHGTVRVNVKVNVDREGNVEDAQLEARGPSKYFARQALEAARQFKFRPPRIGGQGVLSTWRLQFEFTREGTRVVPEQEMP